MGYYIDHNGQYYEGDKIDSLSTDVEQRPSPDYKWDGKWVLDENVIKSRDDAEVKAKLNEIDLKSIRSIREWVAKQTDAPQFALDCEAEAIAERAKL